jgi:hypothetical protein
MERERGRAHLNYEEHVFGFVWVWVWMCGFVGWWSSEPLPVWALAKRFLKPKPAIIFLTLANCFLMAAIHFPTLENCFLVAVFVSSRGWAK